MYNTIFHTMNTVETKLLVAFLFAVIRFSFGMLPIKIYHCLKHWEVQDEKKKFSEKRHGQIECILNLVHSFGGGVLFATCFLHMIPQVYESVEDLKKYYTNVSNFPYSQLVVCIGFFIIYFIEEASHWLISKAPDETFRQKLDRVKPTSVKSIKVAPVANGSSNGFTTDQKQDLEKAQKLVEENSVLEEKKEKNIQQWLRCVLAFLALSFHTIFEGLSIGLRTSVNSIWYLFTAVSVHSITIMFCIGMEMLVENTRTMIIFVSMLILGSMTSIGVLIGLAISESIDIDSPAKSGAIMALEGFSAGTILYITFFEVLQKEKQRRTHRLLRGTFILTGFTLMAALEAVEF